MWIRWRATDFVNDDVTRFMEGSTAQWQAFLHDEWHAWRWL
jgi:hypothetical protein